MSPPESPFLVFSNADDRKLPDVIQHCPVERSETITDVSATQRPYLQIGTLSVLLQEPVKFDPPPPLAPPTTYVFQGM